MRALAVATALGVLGLAPGASMAAPVAAKCMVKPGKAKAAKGKPCRRLPARAAAAASAGAGAGAGAVRMSRDAASPSPAPPVPNAPAAPDVPAVPAAPAPAVAPTRLGVVAREFSLLLSRTTLPSGVAVVELTNRGEDAHNLRVERAGGFFEVPLAESGEVTKATGTLTPGEWRVICALPGHEEAGMHARLTVQAP